MKKMKLMTGLMALTTLAFANASSANIGHKSADDKMKMMDTDGDGRISASEHSDGAALMFSKMDTNGDGNVTASEMDAKKEAKTRTDMTAAEKIKMVDGNGDGTLTLQEHARASQTKFMEMDLNKDGYLSAAEMQEGHDKMKRTK